MQENVAREAGLLQASFIMKSKQAQVYYNELDYTIARAIFERKEAKVQKKSDYILGLDLGVNSVGWAVVDCALQPIAESGSERRFLPTGLRALNARIFQEMVDAKTRVPKNQKRRQMRGMRRSAAQAKRLRRRLILLLAENKMLPDGTDSIFTEAAANRIDREFAARIIGKELPENHQKIPAEWRPSEKALASPFAMRARGLDKDLTRVEFGRVLLHLAKRRGYFSNRGAKFVELFEWLGMGIEDDPESDREREDDKAVDSARKQKDAETRKVLDGLQKLQDALEQNNARTVGEYVWKRRADADGETLRITGHFVEQPKEKGRDKGEIERIGFYATREMTKNEFDLLWLRQKSGLDLSDDLREKIRFLIFHQTPLQSSFQKKPPRTAKMLGLQKYRPRRRPERGSCSFEQHKPRAAKASLIFQEARTRQTINHLRLHDDRLSVAQRENLFAAVNNPDNLNSNGRMPWQAVAKALGERSKAAINFERGMDESEIKKDGLVGNRTAQTIADAVGADFWRGLSGENQEQLVEDLLTIADPKTLFRRLERPRKWGLSKGDALKLATAELEPGYGKHSRLAWNKLLPFLRPDATRENKKPDDGMDESGWDPAGMTYHNACQAAGYLRADQQPEREKRGLRESDIPNIANPIVQKALFETRRVVNAVIARFGSPVEIRVEMARDMATSKEHRAKIEKQQAVNRKRNAEAEEILRQRGVKITRRSRQKYIVWHHEQGGLCPYCGVKIDIESLFGGGGGAEIEHILPQVGFRQNYMNTVVACVACNREKGARSPFQAWQGGEKWNRICASISDCRRGASRRENADEFPNMPKAKKRRIRDENFSPENVDEFVESQLRNTQYIAVAAKTLLEKTGVRVRVTKGGATAELRHLWGLNGVLSPRPQNDNDKKDGEDSGAKRETAPAADDKTKDEKNRRDHRHHAIDALVVALTDHKTLMEMTARYKIFVENGRWPKDPLPLPKGLEFAGTLLPDQFRQTVVSHMKKRKVYGALHEETPYGEGVFETVEKIAPTKKPTQPTKKPVKPAKAICDWIDTEPDAQGKAAWIADAQIRAMLRAWLASGKTIEPPQNAETGEIIDSARVAHRCYVVRKPVEEALKYANREWEPGKSHGRGVNRWIVDKGVHSILSKWLRSCKEAARARMRPNDEEEKEIKREIKNRLAQNPPRMRGRDGCGPEIKTVRIGEIINDRSIVKLQKHKVFRLGSNHHVEVFRNGENETRGRFVSMFEAARRKSRKSRKEPVVNREPDKWPGEWRFQMALHIGDMVRWDASKIPAEHRGQEPVYRVQEISAPNIMFRHHSVASDNAKSKYGRRNKSVNDLARCELVNVGDLGIFPVPDDEATR